MRGMFNPAGDGRLRSCLRKAGNGREGRIVVLLKSAADIPTVHLFVRRRWLPQRRSSDFKCLPDSKALLQYLLDVVVLTPVL